jgi:hypothetical protein
MLCIYGKLLNTVENYLPFNGITHTNSNENKLNRSQYNHWLVFNSEWSLYYSCIPDENTFTSNIFGT